MHKLSKLLLEKAEPDSNTELQRFSDKGAIVDSNKDELSSPHWIRKNYIVVEKNGVGLLLFLRSCGLKRKKML